MVGYDVATVFVRRSVHRLSGTYNYEAVTNNDPGGITPTVLGSLN